MSKAKADPHGWPDYTYPMTIIGQELNVAIDIAAQSLPTLDINIAASAVTLDVNIAASTVTLNVNIESISEGVTFNVAQSGTWTVNAAQTGTWTINIGAPLDASGYLQTHIMDSVQLDVNIAASAVTLDVNIASSAVTLNVKITDSTVTLNVNIESIASGVVFNVAQSGTWTINAVQSGDWSINIESVSAGVTFNVNITGSTATLDINITGSTATLDVNITGQTENVNIDIKAQSVAIKGLTDWAAENAQDIDLWGSATCPTATDTWVIDYTVPSGKTLLIYNWGAASADGDCQLNGYIHDHTAGQNLALGGGTRGFSVALNKPIRVASGHEILVYVRQDSGAYRTIAAHLGGVLL